MLPHEVQTNASLIRGPRSRPNRSLATKRKAAPLDPLCNRTILPQFLRSRMTQHARRVGRIESKAGWRFCHDDDACGPMRSMERNRSLEMRLGTTSRPFAPGPTG